jgi:hypothetical protein
VSAQWFPVPVDVLRDPRVTTLDAEAFGVLLRLYGAARAIGADALGVPGLDPVALLEDLGKLSAGRGREVLDLLRLRGLVEVDGCVVQVTIGWPAPGAVVPATRQEVAPAARVVAGDRSERTVRKTLSTRLRRMGLDDVDARTAWVESAEGRAWCESIGADVSLARSVARRDATGRFSVTSADGDVSLAHGDVNGDVNPRDVTAHGGDTVATDVTADGGDTVTSAPLPHTPSQKEKTQKREGEENRTEGARTVTSAGDVKPTVTSPHGGDTADVTVTSSTVTSAAALTSPAPAPLSLVPPTPKADPIGEVFAHWRKAMGKTERTVLDAKRRAIIAKALKSYCLADLCRAVDGYAASPWHRGQNDRRTPFDGLDLILRDAEHIEAGWLLFDQHGKPPTIEGAAEEPGEDMWEAGLRNLAALNRARTQRAQEVVRG